jgi:hypothetical protein
VGGYAPRARKTMCARGACDALLGGPSTSPVGATMALRLAMCFVFWAASASWAQTDASVPSHATWQRIEVGPVSFFAPSEVRAISPLFAPKEDPASTPSTVTAADNYARAFDGPTLSFVVQSGPALKDIDAGVLSQVFLFCTSRLLRRRRKRRNGCIGGTCLGRAARDAAAAAATHSMDDWIGEAREVRVDTP